MPEGVVGDSLGETEDPDRGFQSSLHGRGVEMKSAPSSGERVRGEGRGRKEELPTQLDARPR